MRSRHGRTRSGWRGAGAVMMMVMAWGGGAAGAAARPAGVATTLSGLPAQPYAERSLRVPDDGVGIRFRAPAAAALATVHTFWTHVEAGCTLALHADDAGAPGTALATASLAEGDGWIATPLSAQLLGGARYHLVATCPMGSMARFGYVLDRERQAIDAGVWRLEEFRDGRMRVRRAPVTPLFALAFVDGTWWGQPYRAATGRPMVRICGANEARQTIVPRERLAVTRVELSARGPDLPPAFVMLEDADGAPLAAGAGPRTSRTGRFVADFIGAPVTLEPGQTYALHIRAAASTGRCARQRALVTDLPIGPPVGGVDVTAVHMTARRRAHVARASGRCALAHHDREHGRRPRDAGLRQRAPRPRRGVRRARRWRLPGALQQSLHLCGARPRVWQRPGRRRRAV